MSSAAASWAASKKTKKLIMAESWIGNGGMRCRNGLAPQGYHQPVYVASSSQAVSNPNSLMGLMLRPGPVLLVLTSAFPIYVSQSLQVCCKVSLTEGSSNRRSWHLKDASWASLLLVGCQRPDLSPLVRSCILNARLPVLFSCRSAEWRCASLSPACAISKRTSPPSRAAAGLAATWGSKTISSLCQPGPSWTACGNVCGGRASGFSQPSEL